MGFTGGVVAGTGVLLAGDEAASSNSPYHFQNIPARELIHQRHLPNVELITQNGKKVRFYDDLVRDKKFVIQFMFTHCTEACPMITHHLVEVQKLLNGRVGRDVFFYSITLSPEEDSSRDMKAYARAHGAGKGWLFLTGKPDDILHLRRSLGFTYDNPKEDADRNNHSGMLRIGNEQLTRWASCQGGARPEWIATVIRTELDSPFLGAVDGVRLADSAARKK
jgi:protein SCO1/2